MEEGVDKYKRIAPSWKEIINEIQALNEQSPALMLRGTQSIFYYKTFFPFPQLKNVLGYCIVADMIDRLTKYPSQHPSCMSSCAV